MPPTVEEMEEWIRIMSAIRIELAEREFARGTYAASVARNVCAQLKQSENSLKRLQQVVAEQQKELV